MTSLNKKFTEKYAKTIAELNKGVYLAALQDDGTYEAPSIKVGPLGGTVNPEKDDIGMLKLNPPAPVSVVMAKKKPIDVIYRLGLPLSELEIADKNDAYFDYFFNTLLKTVLSNYAATVGSPEDVRFGSHYIKVRFREYPDAPSDVVEMILDGSWASEEQVVNE